MENWKNNSGKSKLANFFSGDKTSQEQEMLNKIVRERLESEKGNMQNYGSDGRNLQKLSENELMQVGTVIQSMMSPANFRNFCFPSNYITPALPVHISNSLFISTNANGCAWVEVNFGQFLTNSNFSNTDSVFTANVSNGLAKRSSNVFIHKNVVPTGVLPMNGTVPLTLDNVDAVDLMKENNTTSLYNALRAGPCSVRFDFMGRLDTSSGIVCAGINYSYVDSSNTAFGNQSTANGLAPDLVYSTQKAIEDCPYRLTTAVTNSIEATFVPHDEDALAMRQANFGNTSIQQRVIFLITGAAPNAVVGMLRVSQNWEAKPNSAYSDQISTFVQRAPSMEIYKKAAQEIVDKRMVLRVVADEEFGLSKFSKLLG